jgi:predicted ferric reductase
LKAISALALILLSSLYFVRRWAFELFLKAHFFLAFIAIFSVLLHTTPLGLRKSAFPASALLLWLLNAVIRLVRVINRNIERKPREALAQTIAQRRIPAQARITHCLNDSKAINALQVEVSLKCPMKILPGQYMYLFFSDLGIRRRFQAHPYAITWWDDSQQAKKLSFLIEPHAGMSADLITKNSIQSVVLDGPYGKDLRLEDYETVILIAKGIGIAGILSYVRHMTYRRVSRDKSNEAYRRGLITRKIDVFWVLEENSQERWATEWLRDLSARDSERVSWSSRLIQITWLTRSDHPLVHLLLSPKMEKSASNPCRF